MALYLLLFIVNVLVLVDVIAYLQGDLAVLNGVDLVEVEVSAEDQLFPEQDLNFQSYPFELLRACKPGQEVAWILVLVSEDQRAVLVDLSVSVDYEGIQYVGYLCDLQVELYAV